jgi:hypothetical protein
VRALTAVILSGSDGYASLLSQGFGSNASFVAVFLDLHRYQRSAYCCDSCVLALDALPQASHEEQCDWPSLTVLNFRTAAARSNVLLSKVTTKDLATHKIILLLT